jgi:hypothetical protein
MKQYDQNMVAPVANQHSKKPFLHQVHNQSFHQNISLNELMMKQKVLDEKVGDCIDKLRHSNCPNTERSKLRESIEKLGKTVRSNRNLTS